MAVACATGVRQRAARSSWSGGRVLHQRRRDRAGRQPASGVVGATVSRIGTRAPSTMPASAAPARCSCCLANMLPASRSGTTTMSPRPTTVGAGRRRRGPRSIEVTAESDSRDSATEAGSRSQIIVDVRRRARAAGRARPGATRKPAGLSRGARRAVQSLYRLDEP